jgi:NADPH:quinone reductase-like Zn-dependent oxidoreductase
MTETMKAFVQEAYGSPDVLVLRDVEKPTPDDDQVLVRVRAASVNPADWHHVTGTPYLVRLSDGLRRPKQAQPGTDMAGEVEAVGRNVTRFRPGDEVFGMRSGAFAEYVAVRADRIVRKPANVTFEEAGSVPVAALTALQGLRDKGGLQPGHQVLIIGASGGVGTFAVQIAKALGAEVTAVCSTRNVDMVAALGADQVVDYTREDFVHSGRKYDVVLDGAGNRSIADRRRVLKPTGTLVIVGGPKTNRWTGPVGPLVAAIVRSRFGGPRATGMLAKNNVADLETLRDLLESKQVTPVVERTYPLEDLPEAMAYLGQGHARGKIVIVP